jgi:methyl-accepting chemotaxis protein
MLSSSLVVFILSAASVVSTIALLGRLFVHVTRGQTKELKLLAYSLAILALAWLLETFSILEIANKGVLSLMFESFGIVWYIEHVLLVISIVFLILWAWHYIVLRLLPQFYLSIVAIGLMAFVVSTVIFTSVLFRSAEEQALRSIEADAKTFALTLSELKDRAAFTGAAIAARESLINSAKDNNSEEAKKVLGDPISDYGVAAAFVFNAGGEIITSVGTENIIGQSFSTDPVVKRVLNGEITGSPILETGVETPSIIVRAGSPLISDGKVVGAVVVDSPLDVAFVDRVGEITGLDVTVYAEQHRTATTIRDEDGRPLAPALMEDERMIDITLNQGKVFRSTSTFASIPYFVAAIPLINIDEVRIGALAAGLPQQELLNALEKGTKTSFIVAFGLLVLALIPFFFIAKFLTKSIAEAR